MRSRLGFYRFFDDLGGPFKQFVWFFWTEKHEVSISFSRLFFLTIFGFESGCLGLENKHLAREVLQKTTFAEVGFLAIPGPILSDLG